MIYHVYSKSIADYVIFNTETEYRRMLKAFHYYKTEKPHYCLSKFIELQKSKMNDPVQASDPGQNNQIVEIIAYCLMPTHFHIMLRELKSGGTTRYESNILNSYTRYFNLRHGRKGPLWESACTKIPINTDTHFLHLTRYIHLNPVTAYLVNKPEDWPYSSYKEYANPDQRSENRICNYSGILDINAHDYKTFVDDRIGYQRELAQIKELLP